MTPLDFVIDLAVRALLLSMPLTVALLAFRRLLLSRTINIWLYAMVVGYAAFAAVGVLPWVLGNQVASIAFIVFALISPLLWTIVILVSGIDRTDTTYASSHDAMANDSKNPDVTALPPLILRDPLSPENAVIPVFRHHIPPALRQGATSAQVLNVARAMRGRKDSAARRTQKLLPPPDPTNMDLPFLR